MRLYLLGGSQDMGHLLDRTAMFRIPLGWRHFALPLRPITFSSSEMGSVPFSHVILIFPGAQLFEPATRGENLGLAQWWVEWIGKGSAGTAGGSPRDAPADCPRP